MSSFQQSLQPGSRTRSRASNGRASASTLRRAPRGDKDQGMDFVIDLGDVLMQNEKLEPHEESPDDFLQDGSKKWQSGDPDHFTIPRKGDPWEECFKQVQRFDEEMCRGWREEIDTLLVFAGLFSAAVTAFTVESYRWLRADPEEVTVQLLAFISTQFNSTTSPPVVPSTFSPAASALRVNIFWFTSLTLSLTAVLVGIMCKQWLREYQRYEGLSPREAFPVRQMRYEGLVNWHVPKFLSFLPLLLQAALLIFFAGLLDLLWSLNALLASIITCLVGVVMVLLASTTILPFLQHLMHFSRLGATEEPHSQCAFKSPQSRAFHLLGTSIASLCSQLKLYVFGSTAANYLRTHPSWDSDANWVNYDLEWQNHGRYMERGMSWFEKTYRRNVDCVYHVFHCLESLNEDVAAGCVTQIISDTWHPLVPLVGLLLPCLEEVERMPQVNASGDDGKEMKLARDLVGMSYALIHAKMDEHFMQKCMELCARIANCELRDGEEGYTSLVLEVLSIVVPSKNGAPLPDGLHLQVHGVLNSFLRNDALDMESSDILKFWEVFNMLRQHEYRGADTSPKILAYDLLQEAEAWMSRLMDRMTVSIHEKERVVKEFSNGLCLVYWTTRTNSEIDNIKSSPFYLPFYNFVQYIDGLLSSFGGASLVMSPWNSEVWELVKVEFASDNVENPQ